MKRKFLMMACAALVIGITSCSKDDPTPDPIPQTTVGAYVLNGGKFGSNNSSLTYFNPATKEATYNVFSTKNGKKLGDSGQDMAIYGSKMYINVYNSGVIFVTDKQAKIIKEIQIKEYKAPRSVIAYNGKIYVTYYEGALAQIDTTTFEVKTVKVGANPEALKAANGKIYVANSGGMNTPLGNTVSVVDPIAFKVLKDIKVADNPTMLQADSQGDIYVISMGNYYDVPPTFQRIDAKTDVVSAMEVSIVNAEGKKVILPVPSYMAMGANDKLYIVSGENDATWLLQGKIYTLNAATEKVEGELIQDGTVVKNMYYLSADKVSGNIYAGSSDYKTNGDMYVFSPDGKLIQKFDTGGINPIGVYFLTNK
ncbi:MAG: hypothetical protein RR555_10570 [Bacteroidales bacterium]